MAKPMVFDLLPFTELLLLDEIITNAPTFDVSKIATFHKLLEEPQVWTFSINAILYKLEHSLKNYFEPYVPLHALIILETLTNKHRQILHEISDDNVFDALIDSAKFSNYENIRKKIIRLFQNWSFGRRKIRFGPIKIRLEKEGFKFSPENLPGKHVPEGCCFKCEKRISKIICPSCVQLFCLECSRRTLVLPQFGFEQQVKVCDGCYNIYRSALNNDVDPTSFTTSTRDDHIFLKTMECPICLDIMKKPIIQCRSGHSMCHGCTFQKITNCPICRAEMTQTRNYVVELLIENQRTNCAFTGNGCRTVVNLQEKESHETTCKFRPVQCEGKKFCKWQCNWIGCHHEMERHFSEYHKKTLLVTPKLKTIFKNYYNLNINSYHIQFVNFCDGSNFFWYKQKLDIVKQKVYWLVQLMGSKEEAENYCYEIKIFNGPVRNLTVTEICVCDTTDAEEIFESGKCVTVPLEILKKYINEKNELFCTFSIWNIVEDSQQD